MKEPYATEIDPADYQWFGRALSILREDGYSPDNIRVVDGQIHMVFDPQKFGDADA